MSGTYALQNSLWGFMYVVTKFTRMFFSGLFFIAPLENVKGVNAFDDPDRISQVNKHAERLLNEYGNSIMHLAYSYLHNMADAEEVLQDALIQFIKNPPQFVSAEHEKAWFMRVAINISKNKITYNKIRKTDELKDNLAACEKEDLVFVWDAVKDLPSKYREVIHLFYHEDYSTAQIAKILAKKESTVRSLLQRARFKLKAVLKEVYDFEEQV